MIIKQLSLFIENRSGRLAEITETISKFGINIRTLCVADTESFGILRMIVENPDEVAEKLKGAGLTVSATEAIVIAVPDRPGGLAAVLRILADNGIGVEYMYGFTAKNESNAERAYMVLRVSDTVKAQKLICDAGYPEQELKEAIK